MQATLRLALIAAAAFAVGAAAALALVPGLWTSLIRGPLQVTIGQAQVGGPFELVDHTGRPVTDQDFRGRYMLVFFGFTNCPDICPSGLQVMAAALDRLGARAEKVVPILITVDPERDTPAQLAKYVPSFHPRLVGLTGSTEQVAAVAKAYRVYYKKVDDKTSTAGFTVDHTSIVYLMDPEGRFVTHFTHATPVDAMVQRLQSVL